MSFIFTEWFICLLPWQHNTRNHYMPMLAFYVNIWWRQLLCTCYNHWSSKTGHQFLTTYFRIDIWSWIIWMWIFPAIYDTWYLAHLDCHMRSAITLTLICICFYYFNSVWNYDIFVSVRQSALYHKKIRALMNFK